MPCMDLFELQSKTYKNKILKETKFKISIEAGSSDCWKKYIGDNGITFGIDEFGKSAPYKDIYKYFGLESTNIKKITKKLLKNKMTIKIGINGMGRIGRMVVRSIVESKNKNLKINHINNRSNSKLHLN